LDDTVTDARFEAALLDADPETALLDGLRAGWLDALVPEILVEMDFPQRTKYHAHTNLVHSLRTCAAMPAILPERLAGLFHDIGKRRCITIKQSNGEEQYLGHAQAGAAMTRVILGRLDYDQALVNDVCRWIFFHMDLHMASNNGQSPKAQEKLLAKIEPDLAVLERLQLADIGSMNPVLVPDMLGRALAYHALLAETRGLRGVRR
jgi:tRNA nucleotidyltransferase (CCA-adding enzyme)